MLLHQYYVLNQDPLVREIFDFIGQHGLRCEVHLNRTRFWVPEGPVFTEFALRFVGHAHTVDQYEDLTIGSQRYEL